MAGVFSGGGEDESQSAGDGSAPSGDSAGGTNSAGGTKAADTKPRAVATIPAGDGPDGIAVDGTTVWVSNSNGNTLTRLDTEQNEAFGTPVPVGRNPDMVAVADGVVWVANTDDGTVTRLEADPEPGASRTISVGSGPEGLSLGAATRMGGERRQRQREPHRPRLADRGRRANRRGEQADRPGRRRALRLGDEQLQRDRHSHRPGDSRGGGRARFRSGGTSAA